MRNYIYFYTNLCKVGGYGTSLVGTTSSQTIPEINRPEGNKKGNVNKFKEQLNKIEG